MPYFGPSKFKLHTCITIRVAEFQLLTSERNTLQQLLAKVAHPSAYVLLLPKAVNSLSKKCSLLYLRADRIVESYLVRCMDACLLLCMLMLPSADMRRADPPVKESYHVFKYKTQNRGKLKGLVKFDLCAPMLERNNYFTN